MENQPRFPWVRCSAKRQLKRRGRAALTCGTALSGLWWSLILWASKYSWNGFWREGPILGIALVQSSSQRTRQNRREKKKKHKKHRFFFLNLPLIPKQNKVQPELQAAQKSIDCYWRKQPQNKAYFIFLSDASARDVFPQILKKCLKMKILQGCWSGRAEPWARAFPWQQPRGLRWEWNEWLQRSPTFITSSSCKNWFEPINKEMTCACVIPPLKKKLLALWLAPISSEETAPFSN